MKQIVAFDFDGTITNRDTLLEFIKFAKGKTAFYLGFLLHLPWLLAMKCHLYPNWKTKQMIFSYFFKGVNLDEFDAVCYRFFMERGENLLYQDAVKQIKQHLYRGDKIVVISASIDNWVKPFAESLGINQVLGTQLELSGTGHLTGRFATANCYGEEKVKRLLQLYPDRTQYRLVVYGDSRGDKELLAFSDGSYYKQFNR